MLLKQTLSVFFGSEKKLENLDVITYTHEFMVCRDLYARSNATVENAMSYVMFLHFCDSNHEIKPNATG